MGLYDKPSGNVPGINDNSRCIEEFDELGI